MLFKLLLAPSFSGLIRCRDPRQVAALHGADLAQCAQANTNAASHAESVTEIVVG
jgi:hypothetical protein